MFTFKSQKKELNPKSIFFFWILVISLNFEGYKNEPWLNITNAFLSLCIVQFSSLSRVQPFATPWTAVHQASLSLTNSWSLLKFMSIESVMPSNHLILCCPLPLPPSIFPSIRVFQMSQFFASDGQSIGVSASASVLPMHYGLISFRMDWLDLLAIQGTLKSLLQHHNSKASILRRSGFFMVQRSHPYMILEKP